MSVKSIIIAMIISVSIISCNTDVQKEKEPEKFVAEIDSTMTLSQIAKLNNIGEPYLRTKLNIPKRIGNSYTITEMSTRFHFTFDDLRKVIEDRKNDQIMRRLKAQQETDKKK